MSQLKNLGRIQVVTEERFEVVVRKDSFTNKIKNVARVTLRNKALDISPHQELDLGEY